MSAKKTVDFEAAVKRLDEINALMSKEGITLDESMSLYEEGIALVKVCNKKLEETERRIKILKMSDDGEIFEENFGSLDNN